MDWKELEETTLANDWIAVSQDMIKRNAQMGDSFWGTVRNILYEQMDQVGYRTNEKLTSKWHDMRLKYRIQWNSQQSQEYAQEWSKQF